MDCQIIALDSRSHTGLKHTLIKILLFADSHVTFQSDVLVDPLRLLPCLDRAFSQLQLSN